MAARYSQYIKLTHFVGDLLILNVTNIAANYLKFNNFNIVESPKHIFLILINLFWLALIVIRKPYQISRLTQVIKVVRTQSMLIGLHFLLITSFYFFASKFGYSREYLLTFYTLLLFFNVVSKSVFVLIVRSFRRKGFNFRKVVIIGYGKLSRELGNFINDHPEYGYKLMGYFGNNDNGRQLLGGYAEIEKYVLEESVDEIYCCVPYADGEVTARMVDFGEENLKTVKLITDFREFSFKRMELERYGDFPVINMTSSPLDDFGNKLVKRTFDVAVSLVVCLLVLSWLTPLLAILIRIDSRGPVFFIQNRTGLRNRTFACYKFRTMVVNASANEAQAVERDPRVTAIGRFLRRFSIDELPQFYNVLIGEMSVIGPRPHMLSHTQEFRKSIEKFMARHSIKPGITGLAQTKGYRGEVKSRDFLRNRVQLDRFYIENWSLFFDLKIIAMTIRDVFTNDRVY